MASTGDDEQGSSVPLTPLSTSEVAAEVIPSEDQPWLDYALEQALLLKNSVNATTRAAVHTATTRLSEISSTASAHSLYTLEMIRGFVGETEEVAFAKLKEGVLVAAAHPSISCGVVAGLGILVFKRPRRFLFRYPRRLFVNEESLLSRADAKAKALKQSVANMKHEGKKLEERASMAENDFLSGKTRLRQAGQQIQGVIRSIYRVEKEARGFKDLLGELPRKDASLFRSRVSSLTSEVKKKKVSLGKEVSKITGYGIPI